jgi:hypothetical protein
LLFSGKNEKSPTEKKNKNKNKKIPEPKFRDFFEAVLLSVDNLTEER